MGPSTYGTTPGYNQYIPSYRGGQSQLFGLGIHVATEKTRGFHDEKIGCFNVIYALTK